MSTYTIVRPGKNINPNYDRVFVYPEGYAKPAGQRTNTTELTVDAEDGHGAFSEPPREMSEKEFAGWKDEMTKRKFKLTEV